MRKLVAIAIGLAVLILTPYFLFFSDVRFDYGEPEMRAAIEGTWRLNAPGRTRLELTIAEAKAPVQHTSRGLVRSAAACAHRTLVRSAEACMDITKMELAVTATPAVAGARGTFTVVNTSFREGNLELVLGGISVSATVAPDGHVTQLDVMSAGDGMSKPKVDAPDSLERIAR